ncbi:uncharacterized protein NPIL_386651 [Nephila pilipes]|uniref:Uncharacterized protein n=1 Tax=Nephila pilipes TaxID=299642 RepID=A0A8X6TQ43_NEPPI|nr:uncharacterized protein NPIL_386651 [Nephila pilipes]
MNDNPEKQFQPCSNFNISAQHSNTSVLSQYQQQVEPISNSIQSSNTIHKNIPTFLLALLRFTGLVHELNKKNKWSKLWFFFFFIMLFNIFDSLMLLILNFSRIEKKTSLTQLCLKVFSLVIWICMRRKRMNMEALLMKLQSVTVPAYERIINVLVLIIIAIPLVYSTTFSINSNKKFISTQLAYGNELESRSGQISLIWIKKCLQFLIFPTFPLLVSLLYSTLCLRCSLFLTILTEDIAKYSPHAFGPEEQRDILRRKAKIDDILDIIQEIFSVPSFFFILGYFISCCRALAWSLTHRAKTPIEILILIDGVIILISLSATLWVSGELPENINKLKEAFYKETHRRIIFVGTSGELDLRKELLDKPDFVLTGCGILFYRKFSILAVIGTLLTYTVLVVSTTQTRVVKQWF